MSTRDEFEMWAIKEGYAVKDFIADQYPYLSTQAAWNAWQARQQEINALKAEIERLKSNDHIADISKMVFPPDQCEHKLNMVPADNQDALDAARYRFARDYISEGYCLPGGFALFDDDTTCWDKTIDAAILHAAGGDA